MVKKAKSRVNLQIPTELYDSISEVSDRAGVTITEMMRKFIKLGLLVAEAQESSETVIIIRENGKEKEFFLL